MIAKVYARGDVLAGHIRNGNGVTCRRTDAADEVAKRMARCHTCYLPLVDDVSSRLVVSIADVMSLLAESTPARPKSLKEIRSHKGKIAEFDVNASMEDVAKTSCPLVCGVSSDGKVAGWYFVTRPY